MTRPAADALDDGYDKRSAEDCGLPIANAGGPYNVNEGGSYRETDNKI